jgi:hypothetical protein
MLLSTMLKAGGTDTASSAGGREGMAGDSSTAADYQFNTHLSRFVFSFFAKHIFIVEK